VSCDGAFLMANTWMLEHNIDNVVFEVDSKLVDINFPNKHILVFGLINEDFRILQSMKCKNSRVNFATREANVASVVLTH